MMWLGGLLIGLGVGFGVGFGLGWWMMGDTECDPDCRGWPDGKGDGE